MPSAFRIPRAIALSPRIAQPAHDPTIPLPNAPASAQVTPDQAPPPSPHLVGQPASPRKTRPRAFKRASGIQDDHDTNPTTGRAPGPTNHAICTKRNTKPRTRTRRVSGLCTPGSNGSEARGHPTYARCEHVKRSLTAARVATHRCSFRLIRCLPHPHEHGGERVEEHDIVRAEIALIEVAHLVGGQGPRHVRHLQTQSKIKARQQQQQ